MPLSTDKVEELVSAALQGMEAVKDFSVGELSSASFTLCNRLILILLKGSEENRPVIKAAVEQLWLQCADDTTVN